MKQQYDKYLLALILIAFAARFWDAMALNFFLGDEEIHIPAAVHFMKEGRFLIHWVHPPLNHLVTYAGIMLFGDNPYGWRMLNVLFGSLSVGVIIALGKKLFPDKRVAYLAGAFLAVEPLHIIQSRTNFMEIAPIFFFLCGVYGTLRYIEDRSRSLFWAGGLFGLALAGKWYFIPPIIILAVYALFSRKQGGLTVWQEGIYISSSFVILPAAVYLASFSPWFRMGHNLWDFPRLQLDIYRQLQSLSVDNYLGQFIKFMPSATPWNWFLKPLINGIPMGMEGAHAKYIVLMNNPPVWLLAIPACLWSAYTGIKERNKFLLLTLLLFLGSYGQFVLVDRPIFLYSATAVLPFLYLLISFFIVDIIRRLTPSMLPYRLMMFFVLAWGIYLYPFITGRLVPVSLYEPLLKLGKLITVF